MADHAATRSSALSLPWWLQPAATVTILSGFVVYAGWVAFQGHGYVAPYLSPFYSPPVTIAAIPISPAFWVLWAPAGFRATCYYYRKAYYRSYFADPIACMIAESRRGYAGETAFPFILNNLHRYLLYAALIVLVFLWVDAVRAFDFGGHFGVHLGSLVFLANVVLLSAYTLGCHAFRHMVGGNLDCYSCAAGGRLRFRLWSWVTPLNHRHAPWAWASLFSVVAADVYVRLLGAGMIVDLKLF
ncbi:MAG TPA: succinate dehydrogenase [bacterium]|nr:succinate dehydrogenase [bacterium]